MKPVKYEVHCSQRVSAMDIQEVLDQEFILLYVLDDFLCLITIEVYIGQSVGSLWFRKKNMRLLFLWLRGVTLL